MRQRLLERRWSAEPEDLLSFTRRQDRRYTTVAGAYAWAVPRLPLWRTWLHTVLPQLKGPRVLEVAIGTGYLLTQYAPRFEAVRVDLNRRMLETAHSALTTPGICAPLVRADAVHLPFRDESFDCVVNTMALSGLPCAMAAVAEFRRALRRDGRLVLLDVAYPGDEHAVGMGLTELWKLTGDVIRDAGVFAGAVWIPGR